MAGPLSGIRVLDFTVLTAGGEATGFLCDLGADIIKVEPLTGEVGRRLTMQPAGESTFFLPQNRGKRSIAIDLKQPEGRDAILRLAVSCDAVASNFRLGVMDSLGLGYEDFRRVNPAIVYAETTSYGSEGPDAHLESVDILGQARGGAMSVTGDGFPTPIGFIANDYIAGITLALGLLSGIVHKLQTGEGQKVESSMLGSIITAQGWELTNYLVTGREPVRGGRGHHLFAGAAWGVYDTADGHIVLAGFALEALPRLSEELQAPELASLWPIEPADRLKRMPEVLAALRKAFACRPSDEVVAALRAANVRAEKVRNYADLAGDAQAAANGYIVEVDHPKFGRTRMTGNPLKFDRTPVALAPVAPGIGEHTIEILREAGYSDVAIDSMRSRGIINQEAS
jgi:crotonobetainyl-CoA:carnitine CoA-transferase CaiB-like acyl-CoA transferase